ncbi:contact-dependent growth inhibition system immunity protein [Methylobacter marinus]|jgi:contact-dependent growth inhibition (CDI) system CdiI-like immunity protein|uniref:contact-dependent growth inhibition system immunity protein n=1 Tax=Methylobacter marinus TaxID=34058 RepID=UPI00036918DA|nr:contact-dependent growth inhibition system immunity protein [Methylobacter marinus]
MDFDRKKTIEQLENAVWPHDSFSSHVVQESQRLRKVPVDQLGNEDLRLLIGQQIGLDFVVPLALERLSANPLVSGDIYLGDLLEVVSRLPEEFWVTHPDLNNQAVELAVTVAQALESLSSSMSQLPRRKYL